MRKSEICWPLWAVILACAGLASSCTTNANLTTGSGAKAPAPSLLAITGNSSSVVGTPRQIYLRIADRSSKCWFGPFGSVHSLYMTSADVPPPTSSATVTMNVHRRLANLKNPWGPAVMRIEFKGRSATDLVYTNLGLDAATYARIIDGFTRWANESRDCPPLQAVEPKWAPLPASTGSARSDRLR